MNRNLLITAMILASTLLVSGCDHLSNRDQRTVTGGAIGAAGGALVGAALGNPVAGAAVGGVGGAVIGNQTH